MINHLLQFLYLGTGVYMLFSFISKGPKPKTIADFWTMIWQEDVCNIVCLTNLTEGTKVRVYLRDIKYYDIHCIENRFLNKLSTMIILKEITVSINSI